MFNPFYVYIYSFLLAFTLYILDFSTLYPQLSVGTVIFFIFSFIVAFLIGRRISKKEKFSYVNISYHRSLIYITIALLVAHSLEFLYVGYIPFFSSEVYKSYSGIPTFHVILYTFNIFFSVYLFHVILSNPKKYILYLLFLLTLLPSILIMSRGMLVNIIIGALFIFLYQIKDMKYFLKHTLWKVVMLGIVGLYLFGVSGNVRNNTINNFPDKFSSAYIMEVGGASNTFRQSIIPKEYFWGYLYVSSPLANLQQVIETHEPTINVGTIKEYFANEVIMDFISKRIFPAEFSSPKDMQLISEGLTVGTGFRGSYYYLGWLGVILTFIILMGVSYLYINFLSLTNPFRLTGIAMLANIVALFTFDNMIMYSGMSFQLIFPIIWELYIRFEIPINGVFLKVKDLIYIKGEKRNDG